MRDRPETPDERQQRRRVRRWKRRARIVAPFLGVPILLAALALSVDFIEYRPQPKRERLSDQPIRIEPDRVRPSVSHMPVAPVAPMQDPHTATSDVVGVEGADDFDVMLPPTSETHEPTPPAALGTR
jgi:hypothetical protein